jgi:acyl-CoA hydrolase
MEFYTIVRPEHLNHYGYLFGGNMLKWVDEYAYIAALREFPSCRFVTRAMDSASFTQSVNNGALLSFKVSRVHLGSTSVRYKVEVRARNLQEQSCHEVFNITVTLVAIDRNGQKQVLPDPISVND